MNKVDNDWEFTKTTSYPEEIKYGDGFGITILDRWSILTKEDSELLYFNFNMAKDTYALQLPNSWKIVDERIRTKTNYINKNIKIKNWYIIVHPDNGSLIFYKEGATRSVAITYPYSVNYNYYYVPTVFDKSNSQEFGNLTFRRFWIIVDDQTKSLRIFKYGSEAPDQWGIKYLENESKYEYFNAEFVTVPKSVTVVNTTNRSESYATRNIDACKNHLQFYEENKGKAIYDSPNWNGVADGNGCKKNCSLAGMLGNKNYLKTHWNNCISAGDNPCLYPPFRWDETYGWGVCMNGGKKVGSNMCCDYYQLRKNDSDSCNYYRLKDEDGPRKVMGDTPGTYDYVNYIECGKAIDAGVDLNPCNNPYFIQEGEHDMVKQCRGGKDARWGNPIPFYSEPCLNQIYNDKNKEECCTLGFRPRDMCVVDGKNLLNSTNDPCNSLEYIRRNVKECRELNFEICKVDNDYLYNNAVECRQKGVDACKLFKYADENPEECRTMGYEPCKLFKDYLIQNDVECRDKGYEACLEDGFKLDKTRGNPAKCRALNKDYEACKNGDYLQQNSKECRGIAKEYEACGVKNFMFNNSVECRNVDPVKYESCDDPNFVLGKSRECRAVNGQKYEACNNLGFVLGNSKECRNEANPKREACENVGFLKSQNSQECREVNSKFEACAYEDFLVRNSKECRTKPAVPVEACKIMDFRASNAQECRDVSPEYEMCKIDNYLFNNSEECRTKAKPAPIEACARPEYKKTHFDECAPRGYPDCSTDNIGSSNYKQYCVGDGKPYKVQEEGSFNLAQKANWTSGGVMAKDEYTNQTITINYAKTFAIKPQYILLYFDYMSDAKPQTKAFYMAIQGTLTGFSLYLPGLDGRLKYQDGYGCVANGACLNSYTKYAYDRTVRWYAIDVQSSPAGQVFPPQDCKEGVWSNWSECVGWKDNWSNQVGGSLSSVEKQTRIRKRYGDVAPQYGGKECSQNVEMKPYGCPVIETSGWDSDDGSEPIRSVYSSNDQTIYRLTENLPGSPPPEDCQVSVWSAWGACDAQSSQRTRTRTVTKQPAFGGKECPVLSETETNPDACPQNFYLTSRVNGNLCLGGKDRRGPAQDVLLAFQNRWDGGCHRFKMEGSKLKSYTNPELAVEAHYAGTRNDQPLFYHTYWQGDWQMNGNGSLQRQGSGRCIHPKGGWPNVGVDATLYDGCWEDRLGFNKEYSW